MDRINPTYVKILPRNSKATFGIAGLLRFFRVSYGSGNITAVKEI